VQAFCTPGEAAEITAQQASKQKLTVKRVFMRTSRRTGLSNLGRAWPGRIRVRQDHGSFSPVGFGSNKFLRCGKK
jgi:hypothetical protein